MRAKGSHSRIAHTAGGPGPSRSGFLARSYLPASSCSPLLAGSVDGELQRVGQHPAVLGADGTPGFAVRGGVQGYGHGGAGVGGDGDLPADVLARLQPRT